MSRSSLAVGVGMSVAVVAAAGPQIAEAYEINVRGQAHFETDIRTAGTTVGVGARLSDDLGEPVPQQSVQVGVYQDGREIGADQLVTDYFGRFSTVFELAPGRYDVQFDYEGASHVAGVHTAETIEVREAPAELELEAPEWIRGDSVEAPLEIRATAAGTGIPTFATVVVDDRATASVDLDRRGRGEFDLQPHLRPGNNDVGVVLEETEYRDATAAETSVRQSVDARLDGSLERVFERTDRGRLADLVVEDARGPIEGVGVEFRLEPAGSGTETSEDERVVERSADRRGRASALFGDDELPEGRWRVTAGVDPPVGERLDWESDSFEHSEPVWPAIVRGIALVVLAAGIGWYGRRELVAARDWIARRLAGEDDEPEAEQPEPVFEEIQDIEPREIDRPDECTETGPQAVVVQVWDEWRTEPVAEATVALQDHERREEWTSGPRGLVEVPEIGSQGLEVRIRAPGFVPARAKIEPAEHDGAVRLELTPVPLQIRRAYRRIVRRARGQDPWGRLTPRQIEEALRQLGSGDRTAPEIASVESRRWRRALEDWDQLEEDERIDRLVETVTAILEETNFSGRDYELAVWERTRPLLEKLARRLESQPGGRR